MVRLQVLGVVRIDSLVYDGRVVGARGYLVNDRVEEKNDAVKS
jgi:hypothetical protein